MNSSESALARKNGSASSSPAECVHMPSRALFISGTFSNSSWRTLIPDRLHSSRSRFKEVERYLKKSTILIDHEKQPSSRDAIHLR